MFKKHKNAVSVVGANNAAIQGEYLGKGTLTINRKDRMFILLVMFVVSLFLVPVQAMAAMDVTDALAGFTDLNTAIPVVGGAFLLALGILAAWKLIRGAF